MIEALESRILLTAVSRPLAMPVRIGANYADWWYNSFETPESDQRITKLANNTDSNTIEIVQTWYMDTGTDNTIYQHAQKSLTDSGVIHAIQLAKSLGLSVILKPHVDVFDSAYWRGSINPSNTTAWFDSYKSFINHYADMAKTYGVDMFCVGTELKSMDGSNFTTQWNSVIDGIEQRYTGQLTYAANWDDFKNVKFWNRLDVIGIDQYTPLGPSNSYEATPSVDTLVSRWQPIVDDVANWRTSQGLSQHVMMTEIGYRAVGDTHRTFYSTGSSYDADAQKRAFDAATRVWTSQDWMDGMLWWAWHQDAITDFSPMDKPAQNAMKTGSISGTVFNDLDGDGVQDAGENAITGWKVYLDANNNSSLDAGEFSVTTNASGQYTISDLLVGNYKLRLTLAAGYGATTSGDIALDGGQVATGKNLGAKLGGVVLDNTSFKENFDSWTAGTNLPDNNKQPKIYATAAGATYVRVTTDQSKSGPNSALFHDATMPVAQNYYPQMLINGLGPTATSGYTNHAVDISFDYFIPAVADQANYFSDGMWLGFAEQSDFTLMAPVLIKGDGIFIPSDGGSGGGTIGTVAGGSWHHVAIHFAGISGGQASFTTMLDNLPAVVTTVPTQGHTKWNNFRWELRDNAPKDFYLDNIDIHLSAGTGTISGNVFNDINSNAAKDAGENGIANWVVYLDENNNNTKDASEISTTTNASGAYIFTGLASGTYHVRQQFVSGLRKSLPGNGVQGYDVSVNGNDVAGKDLGMTSNILLAGKVFNDLNSNGTQDAGESAIAGVTISIISGGSTITTRVTDGNGAWRVQGLGAGSGEAKITLPGGYTATWPVGGSVTGAMTAGQQNQNLNFGIKPVSPAPTMFAQAVIFNSQDDESEHDLSWI